MWLYPLPRTCLQKMPTCSTGSTERMSAFNNHINVTASTGQNIGYLHKIFPVHREHNLNITGGNSGLTVDTSATSQNSEKKKTTCSVEIYRGTQCRVTLVRILLANDFAVWNKIYHTALLHQASTLALILRLFRVSSMFSLLTPINL